MDDGAKELNYLAVAATSYLIISHIIISRLSPLCSVATVSTLTYVYVLKSSPTGFLSSVPGFREFTLIIYLLVSVPQVY